MDRSALVALDGGASRGLDANASLVRVLSSIVQWRRFWAQLGITSNGQEMLEYEACEDGEEGNEVGGVLCVCCSCLTDTIFDLFRFSHTVLREQFNVL